MHRQEGLPQHPRGEDQGLEEALGHRAAALRLRVPRRARPVRARAGQPGHGAHGVQRRDAGAGRGGGQGGQLVQHRDLAPRLPGPGRQRPRPPRLAVRHQPAARRADQVQDGAQSASAPRAGRLARKWARAESS